MNEPIRREMTTRCIIIGCKCSCFKPTAVCVRQCETCGHGWIGHVLSKLTSTQFQLISRLDVGGSMLAYDIASMILFGTHAVPVRMKILFDHLNAGLMHSEIVQALHSFGWTYQDYIRGYITQDAYGQPRTRWIHCTRDEELVVMQQFLRFVETRAIAYNMLFAESSSTRSLLPSPFCPPPPPISTQNPPSLFSSLFPLPPIHPEKKFGGNGRSFVQFSDFSPTHRGEAPTEAPQMENGELEDREVSSDFSRSSQNDKGIEKRSRKCFAKVFDISMLKRDSSMISKNKKRVLCTMCNKTFCDKGALKIHYSAVHLKEMHKCTIAGCSMWFSSRRSRNRHSANPNPRLHMTHSSKKLPDDARIVDDGSGRCLVDRVSIPNSILYPPVVANGNSDTSGTAEETADGNDTTVHARLYPVPCVETMDDKDSTTDEENFTSIGNNSSLEKSDEICVDDQ